MEITNLKTLNQVGGSFPLTKQIGYASFYLVANMEVTGDNYDTAKVTFTCSAGQFTPVSPIFLDPQNAIVKDLEFTSGHMKLQVHNIELTFPTPEQNGYLSLNCSFTDINGQGNRDYNGIIAEWNNQGPIK